MNANLAFFTGHFMFHTHSCRVFLLYGSSQIFYGFTLEAVTLAIVVAFTMLILFPVVYRSARLVWLNFFIRYDKNYSKSKQILSQAKEVEIEKVYN